MITFILFKIIIVKVYESFFKILDTFSNSITDRNYFKWCFSSPGCMELCWSATSVAQMDP